MTVIQNLISDLREKRLWPVAVALLVALVAVPLLLSGGSQPVRVAQAPIVVPAGPAPALPAVSVTTTPSNARLTGPQRNPFTPQVKAHPSAATPSAAANSKPAAKSASKSAATGTSTTTTSTTTSTTTTSTSTTSTQTPTPTGLTATQSYHVTFSMTNSAGGVDTIDPLERLSVLPSAQQPLLVEFGVANGGHRVLFVVQPGTIVRGPGACTPGPIDCEILSMAPNQVEWYEKPGAVGPGLFAVTGINADDFPSATDADKARLAESGAGHDLLQGSTLKALSLFQYRPSLGAVVDLSNLTVGGS